MSIEIYSTDTDSGQISVFRKTEEGYKSVQEIPVGNAPRGGVKFTKNGRGFVSNTSANTVAEIDALTHREVARITVGFGPRGLGIVPGDRYLLVSNSGSNTVSVVDLETRKELSQISVGRDPRHMAIDKTGNFAYVCIWGSGYIAKLDITSLKKGDIKGVREVGRIRIEENSHPYSLNIDRNGKYGIVACNSVKYVPVIDLETSKIVARIPVKDMGGRAVAITPDNKYALVTLEVVSEIAVIRLEDFKVTRYLPTGPAPRGIALDDVSLTAYVSAFARSVPGFDKDGKQAFTMHSISVIELAGVDLSSEDSKPRLGNIQVGYGPCSVVTLDTELLTAEAIVN